MKVSASLMVLLWAGSVAAQRPPEVAPLLDAARRERAAGHADAALDAVRRATVLAPRDPEVLLLAGTIQADAGRTDKALQTLSEAAAIAPGDDDVRLAIARVRYFRGEHEQAVSIVTDVLGHRPADQDARDLLARARRASSTASRRPRWRLDSTSSYSAFEDDVRDRWLEGGVSVGYRMDERSSIAGRVEVADRFGRTDTYLEGRIDHRFAPSRFGYFAIGATPGADFLPRWTAAAGGGIRAWEGGIGPGVLTLDARHAQFQTGSVETLSPGIEQQLFRGRAWVTGKLIHTWDERDGEQTGFIGRIDAQASDRVRVFIGYADAPETVENVTLTTRTVFGGAVLDVTDRLTVRFDYARDDRERSYVRHGFATGLGVRF